MIFWVSSKNRAYLGRSDLSWAFIYLFSGLVSWRTQLLVVSTGMLSKSPTCSACFSHPSHRLGSVFSEELRCKDKQEHLCKRTSRRVHILLMTRLELERPYFLLILLAKAQSERGLRLQSGRVKGLDTGGGREWKIFLHSIISYGWDDHASRFAQKSLRLFLLPL